MFLKPYRLDFVHRCHQILLERLVSTELVPVTEDKGGSAPGPSLSALVFEQIPHETVSSSRKTQCYQILSCCYSYFPRLELCLAQSRCPLIAVERMIGNQELGEFKFFFFFNSAKTDSSAARVGTSPVLGESLGSLVPSWKCRFHPRPASKAGSGVRFRRSSVGLTPCEPPSLLPRANTDCRRDVTTGPSRKG